MPADTPKKRRRPRTSPASLVGLTLDQWQRDSGRLRFALEDPRFREIISVVTTERHQAVGYLPIGSPAMTEMARYGVMLGYELALDVIARMARPPAKLPPDMIEPTYEPDSAFAHQTAYD